MALKIRDIEKKDVEAVLVLCRAMAAESPLYRTKTFSEKKVRDLLMQIVTAWAAPLFGMLAETEDGQVVAMLGAGIQDAFMCEEKFSLDFGVFVLPEHRGSSVVVRLIKKYEEWALSKGVKPEDIHLGISSGVEMGRTVCLYERLGYKLVSYNMVKGAGNV